MDGSQTTITRDQSDMVSTQSVPQALFSITKGEITYHFYDAMDKHVRVHFPGPQREVMVAERNGSWGVAISHPVAIGEKCQISAENPGRALWVGSGEAAEKAIITNVVLKKWEQPYRNCDYRRAIMTLEA